MDLPTALIPICQDIADQGGRAYLVGGWVRDLHLGLPSKDIDLEVFGLPHDALMATLSRHGRPHSVGRSFDVIKLRLPDHAEELDWALPRSHLAGAGDPNLSLEQASARRDLRCNALYYDPLSSQTLDPTGGLADLRARQLHQVSDAGFLDDPLRALRAIRLAVQKGLDLHPELAALLPRCPLSGLPPERIRGELLKICLAPEPHRAIRLMADHGLYGQLLPDSDPQAAAQRVEEVAGLRSMLSGPPLRLLLVLGAWLLDQPAVEDTLTRLDLVSAHGAPLRRWVPALCAAWERSARPPSDTDLRREADQLPLLPFTLLSCGLLGLDTTQQILRLSALGVDAGPLPRLLDGAALQALGIPPGPRMGAALRALRESQWAGRVSTPEQARDFVRRWGRSPQ